MSDSALNDNAIFASFAVERNSAIWRSALSARRTPIASLARSRRLDCHFGIDDDRGAVAPLHLGSTKNCDKRSPSPANSSIRGAGMPRSSPSEP
jgi:hypothetical protein